MKTRYVTFGSTLIAVLCLFAVVFVYKDLKKAKKQAKKHAEILTYMKDHPEIKLGNIQLPPELQLAPLSDINGVVVDAKPIHIRNVIGPFNCSLIKNQKGGYWIFFRHDVIDQKEEHPFFSYIGCAELDENFEQTEREYFDLKLGSNFAEDPRVFFADNKLYVMYNSTIDNSYSSRRLMHLAELDQTDMSVVSTAYFDPQFQTIEKNWTPFEYKTKKGDSLLLVEYYVDPHVFMHVKEPTKANQFSFLRFKKSPFIKAMPWPNHIWGAPRGGTPPQLVDGEYLGFFHSSFRDRTGVIWYLMGAYTFQAEPPFKLTRISKSPILFEGIFDSALSHTSNPIVRCIFPSGFVVEKKGDQELIHVSCGENDAAMKIVTFDKSRLLDSLRRI